MKIHMKRSFSILFSLVFSILLIQLALANNCTIQDCMTCLSAQTCSVCSGSLKPNIDKSECVLCDVDNCAICESDSSCSVCSQGYSIAKNSTSAINGTSGNLCFLCDVDMCDQCIGDNQCGSCVQGYTLVEGSCLICSYPCATCSSDLKCQTCITPDFFITPDGNKQCFAHVVPFCKLYDIPNYPKCSTCEDNYILNTTSNICERKCVYPCLTCPNDICNSCQVGYYLNSTSSSCKQCLFGCEVCNSQGCLMARSGFYLNGLVAALCLPYCSTCSSSTSCLTFSSSYQGFISIIVNSQAVLAQCPAGCARCSTQNISICIEAKAGYTVNSDGNVLKCAQTCKSCSATTTTKCLSCYTNTFLSNNNCLSCDSTCLTCQSGLALTTCTTCRQGSYLSGTKCMVGCPENCLSCSSATNCIKCASGYTLVLKTGSTDYVCAPCIQSCQNCANGLPSICLSCPAGSYLKDSKCSQCPSFCRVCSSSGCSQCYSGYKLGTDKTCTENCKLPCATCGTNPSVCSSCILGYTYSNGICNLQLTCSGGCTTCPYGYGLVNGECKQCTGTGCRSCSAGALNTCTSCVAGYFFDKTNSVCTTCPVSCTTCQSSSVCTKCAVGYTSNPKSIVGTGFTCLPCIPQCATCLGQIFNCVTCAPDYEFIGWKCIKKVRYIFGCRLRSTLSIFHTKLYGFLQGLMQGLGTPKRRLLFTRIYEGSVVVEGTIEPSQDQSMDAQYRTLSNTLTQGLYVGDMQIQTSSVTLTSSAAAQKNDNLGLILGICIPVGILILAAIILIVYKINTKNRQQQFQKDQKYDKNGVESSQAITSNQKYQL